MSRPKTPRERIETRIARKRGDDVFLPREFRDLGGEDQVLRVLRILVREKRLVPGSATVSTAVPSSRAFPATPSFTARADLLEPARQALTKLGVKWEPSDARWLIS